MKVTVGNEELLLCGGEGYNWALRLRRAGATDKSGACSC